MSQYEQMCRLSHIHKERRNIMLGHVKYRAEFCIPLCTTIYSPPTVSRHDASGEALCSLLVLRDCNTSSQLRVLEVFVTFTFAPENELRKTIVVLYIF